MIDLGETGPYTERPEKKCKDSDFFLKFFSSLPIMKLRKRHGDIALPSKQCAKSIWRSTSPAKGLQQAKERQGPFTGQDQQLWRAKEEGRY